ncbi:phage portal protein [Oceanobacillus arenosus]|uniref:Phage portal protein n=1 Tax=Oceanobacillus arenosus TaxID=1229153 RepID=A0A3D8PQV8_9BACI|nr:phage portal protein [Oceanobacillus arenosus]RDW17628.1 phage portal protein [Oceanobacillus arenosus]
MAKQLGGEKLKLFNRFKKRSKSVLEIPFAFGDISTPGYTRLSDNPDVRIAVDKIADLVSNMTIHLMENTDEGDKRVRNGLSRKIDIEPHRNMTRKAWVYKIVSDMLMHGDGNSVVHIGVDSETGWIDDLTPFQMAAVNYEEVGNDYFINYNGNTYKPDEVVHFVINPDPNRPYKGTGYRVLLRDIIKNLSQADKTKNSFMSGKYMPSIILSVDAMTEELASKEGREEILNKYVTETEGGVKPWVLPADLIKVEQVKPLSLKDIAIIEGVELDKKTVAGLIGVPAFFLGVGEFKKEEYNNFINTRIYSIGQIISQTLTRDLLFDPNWFFRLNPRSLFSYDLTEMVGAGTQMVDRNAMRRNELRDWVGLDPDSEMQELIILENYIPAGMLGSQNKLKGGEDNK